MLNHTSSDLPGLFVFLASLPLVLCLIRDHILWGSSRMALSSGYYCPYFGGISQRAKIEHLPCCSRVISHADEEISPRYPLPLRVCQPQKLGSEDTLVLEQVRNCSFELVLMMLPRYPHCFISLTCGTVAKGWSLCPQQHDCQQVQ